MRVVLGVDGDVIGCDSEGFSIPRVDPSQIERDDDTLMSTPEKAGEVTFPDPPYPPR